jgi:hypothetical protein
MKAPECAGIIHPILKKDLFAHENYRLWRFDSRR